MDIAMVAIICVVLMFVLMMLGIPLPFILGSVAIFGMLIGWGSPALARMGTIPFSILYTLQWTPLPLFILLGCLISESGMGSDIFKVASNWLSRLPGGLAVSVIVGEAAMAATVGLSTACIVTVGKVAVPEMEKLGYNRRFSLGALCVGGVLGPLIPPSATMIVYATLAEVSLGKLFIAGIIPGVLLAIMLSLFASITCLIRPKLAPRPAAVSWRERLSSSRKIWPLVLLIFCVIGGIYLGVVTPTEAAGVACVITTLIGILFFGLRLPGLRRAMMEAAVISVMIMFMIITANIFSYVLGSGGLAKDLVSVVASAGLSPLMVIIAINILVLLLGFVIDGMTIMILGLPLLIPLIISLGFDPIWFGIVFLVNIQIGIITPPMAIDLIAVKTIFDIPINELVRGVVPFLTVALIFFAIIIAFPQLSLWLPSLMAK
jgi:C4-dicarboxylate transporter DctM subunit